jgi:hypothetical protein
VEEWWVLGCLLEMSVKNQATSPTNSKSSPLSSAYIVKYVEEVIMVEVKYSRSHIFIHYMKKIQLFVDLMGIGLLH